MFNNRLIVVETVYVRPTSYHFAIFFLSFFFVFFCFLVEITFIQLNNFFYSSNDFIDYSRNIASNSQSERTGLSTEERMFHQRLIPLSKSTVEREKASKKKGRRNRNPKRIEKSVGRTANDSTCFSNGTQC